MSINKCFLSGNITRDPNVRATAGGTSILEFGLASNDRRKNPQTGQWEDVPNFFECCIFGNRADALSRILAKGMHVSLEGKLRWSSWEKDGQRRSKIEVIVDELDLMSPRQGQQAPRAPQMPQGAPQQPMAYSAPPQAQTAPNMASQAPVQGYPMAQGTYQPTMPQAPQPELYDESIPF